MKCKKLCWKTMEPFLKSIILCIEDGKLLSPFVCDIDPKCDGYGKKVFELKPSKKYIEVLYNEENGFCDIQRLIVYKDGVAWEKINEMPKAIYEKLPSKAKEFTETFVTEGIWTIDEEVK